MPIIGQIIKEEEIIRIRLETATRGTHLDVPLSKELSNLIIKELRKDVNKIDGDEIRKKLVRDPLLHLLD